MTQGYSGTPLGEKIGLRRGMRCWFHNMPADVRAALAPGHYGIDEQQAATEGLQCIWLFETERARLERELAAAQQLMASNGFIWVSWPKKSAHAETDISEGIIREVALSQGLVDTKVCAVDQTWSALKLVVRKQLR
ncbi:MAG: DUF3052 family protein [Sphingomonas sp.]|uniref:DUF3052 family protein n=1 Tax=Sphingomonas sp. TaxID=28214 RepID=UPI001B1CEA6E|nr:DUF3052 family protein [Sphingomonas sp.]MBO9622612.1 DUF3052 family protein [Sphingomonas sp.]